KLPDVGVSPTRADALKAISRKVAAAAVRPRAVAIVHVVRIRVEHAEATLRGLPHFATRVDQLVGGVVLEMKMLMACRELEQTIRIGEVSVAVRVHVFEWTSDEDVGISEIWRRHRKAQDIVRSRRHAPLLHATEVGGEIFDAVDPVLLCGLRVHDEVRKTNQIRNAGRTGGGSRRPDRGGAIDLTSAPDEKESRARKRDNGNTHFVPHDAGG